MKVRDRTKSIRDYKGRLTDASDSLCPCRSCYSPHDCGYRAGDGKWIIRMECVIRDNKGCPDPKPRPQHLVKFSGKNAVKYFGKLYEGKKLPIFYRRCKRCGSRIELGESDFRSKEAK